jgi:hypothetical protein
VKLVAKDVKMINKRFNSLKWSDLKDRISKLG